MANFFLHWFPNRVTLKSLSLKYSLYLGTISMVLFGILTVTGVFLMFLYVPSVERAYWGDQGPGLCGELWLVSETHASHQRPSHGGGRSSLHMFRVFSDRLLQER